MVALAPGSIGKNRPVSRRCAFSSSRRTPASTVQSKSSALTATIRSILLRSTETPPRTGSALPSIEVPAPNGTTGTPKRAHSFTQSATSAVVRANTTASGSASAKCASLCPCCRRTPSAT